MSPEGVFEPSSRENGCRAAVAGSTVYLRCEALANGERGAVAEAQALLRHAESVLLELGSRLEDTRRAVIGVTDEAEGASIVGLAEEWLRHVFPAGSGVIARGMARQGALLELVIIAEIGAAPASPPGASYPRRTT